MRLGIASIYPICKNLRPMTPDLATLLNKEWGGYAIRPVFRRRVRRGLENFARGAECLGTIKARDLPSAGVVAARCGAAATPIDFQGFIVGVMGPVAWAMSHGTAKWPVSSRFFWVRRLIASLTTPGAIRSASASGPAARGAGPEGGFPLSVRGRTPFACRARAAGNLENSAPALACRLGCPDGPGNTGAKFWNSPLGSGVRGLHKALILGGESAGQRQKRYEGELSVAGHFPLDQGKNRFVESTVA